ncbi:MULTISPECIES: hypothetical protein [Streptomyces]|uniref:Uncharacterized protein n=1 Tax=Streptomyces chilikensis TaxID=1194079 RepID=A0ABV3EMK7_9ACTN|nr:MULTISPECIES: hypothetical protein [Streptomyces]MDH6223737.1 hypothetical protein [Streptomyces sp. MJP52]
MNAAQRWELGLAATAGYVVGRTRTLPLVIAVAIVLAGREEPRAYLAGQGRRLLMEGVRTAGAATAWWDDSTLRKMFARGADDAGGKHGDTDPDEDEFPVGRTGRQEIEPA